MSFLASLNLYSGFLLVSGERKAVTALERSCLVGEAATGEPNVALGGCDVRVAGNLLQRERVAGLERERSHRR